MFSLKTYSPKNSKCDKTLKFRSGLAALRDGLAVLEGVPLAPIHPRLDRPPPLVNSHSAASFNTPAVAGAVLQLDRVGPVDNRPTSSSTMSNFFFWIFFYIRKLKNIYMYIYLDM